MKKKNKDSRGYSIHPSGNDIYDNEKEEREIDPENTSLRKRFSEKLGKLNVRDFCEDMTGEDLDIPGSEDDEEEENAGSEDEENNYYSIGGDDHDDLEDDNQ